MTTYPPATVVGGNWAASDRFVDAFNAAAEWSGVPANLMRAVVQRESSGVYPPAEEPSDRYCATRKKPDGTCNLILPFVGIYETTATTWGCDWPTMLGDPAAQIRCMAVGLSHLADRYGGWENAATVYFGGERALAEVVTDESGMRSDVYADKALADWAALDAKAGGPMAPTVYDIANVAHATRMHRAWAAGRWTIVRERTAGGNRYRVVWT